MNRNLLSLLVLPVFTVMFMAQPGLQPAQARHHAARPPAAVQSEETDSYNTGDSSDEQSSTTTENQQEPSADSSSTSEAAPESKSSPVSLMDLGLEKGPLYVTLAVLFMLLASGMIGLVPAAVVWHVGKLLRGGRPPQIG